MKRSPTSPCAKTWCGSRAFTLVEMLVAMTVLTMMMAFLATMLSASNRIWVGGQSGVDNLSKGRVLLDLLSEDLKNGLFRSDLCSFPAGTIAFYTRRPGFTASADPVRDVSLVRYELQATTILQRADQAITWNEASTQVSFGHPADLPTAGSLVARDTATGVLGFKVLFLDAAGAFSPTYLPGATLRGFDVAIAVIDSKTLKTMSQDQIDGLRTAFESRVTGTRSVKQDWDAYLATGIDWQKYPAGLGQGIRIFERYVALP